MPQQGRGRGAITILDGRGSTNQVCSARRLAELFNAEEIERVAMTAINKQRGRHKIEELLPWHATIFVSLV